MAGVANLNHTVLVMQVFICVPERLTALLWSSICSLMKLPTEGNRPVETLKTIPGPSAPTGFLVPAILCQRPWLIDAEICQAPHRAHHHILCH